MFCPFTQYIVLRYEKTLGVGCPRDLIRVEFSLGSPSIMRIHEGISHTTV
jgi:hypothetical protein